MTQAESTATFWTLCLDCQGRGKKSKRISKKVRFQYTVALQLYYANNQCGALPVKPKGHLFSCPHCTGSGIIATLAPAQADTQNFPHVAIIGAGIGGVALAVACLHRKIPFTLFERDLNFDARSQGYGLTLQQASKALDEFGINSLKDGVISTKHVVHTTDGTIIGEWGMRKWMQSKENKKPKNPNIHIARQALRLALLEQLGGHHKVKWGHQLADFQQTNKNVTLKFQVNGTTQYFNAGLVVGADGIRSTVRKILFGAYHFKLRYLGCIVILGICPLHHLENLKSPLLDSATVFQTANGNERIYIMPYTTDSVMWQLSFPMLEKDALALSKRGKQALKVEAILRTQWHQPIPEIVAFTQEIQISGYPVYDRQMLQKEHFKNAAAVTLLGDAAHPMSPFKGQGANQALLDALSLARTITKECFLNSDWEKRGIRESVLQVFESEMIIRSAVKVHDSAAAAQFLHSQTVLKANNSPRGSGLIKK